jgi:shikimate kinase
MNLVLIGYRGTGKSQVGQLLSRRLEMPYVGIDAAIVAKAGMSIPQIVEQIGWPGFRDMETAAVRDLSGRDNIIIDTGGGVIEQPENIRMLREHGCIFWLKARVASIVERIQGDAGRPALTPGKSFTEEVAEILERRTPLYAAAARFQIDTDEWTPEQVAVNIIALWEAEIGLRS